MRKTTPHKKKKSRQEKKICETFLLMTNLKSNKLYLHNNVNKLERHL